MMNEMFYRINNDGNADIYHNCGEMVTIIDDATTVYPIDSNLSCAYEHCDGITISIDDAKSLCIEAE